MRKNQHSVILERDDPSRIAGNYSENTKVTVTPFVLGFIWGPKALLGFLPGAIVSGVQMAISASNTGGAWDNAKKFIEAGLMKDGDEIVRKHLSLIHI